MLSVERESDIFFGNFRDEASLIIYIDLFCDVTDVTHEYSVEAKELGGNGWCGTRRS